VIAAFLFGCYLRAPQTEVGRPYGLLVLTLAEDRISAITWFSDSSVFPHFGLPRILLMTRAKRAD
jgi:RNA polymerase sigma-70 factor (ECF subfamily)